MRHNAAAVRGGSVTDGQQMAISLVVGLGNPGAEYAATRHNAGFMVIDRLLKLLPGSFEEKQVSSGVAWQGRTRGRNLTLLKPMTFMNLSGKAVAAMMRAQHLTPAELLVVYDDVDVQLGRLRLRADGSSGGHHGMDSIIAEIGSQGFSRLRFGIGSTHRRDQVEFVLGRFADDEQVLAERSLNAAAEAAQTVICRGMTVAMNTYNRLDLSKEIETEKNS